MDSVILTLAILFLSTLTRATFGFGDALLAMPLLTLVVGIQTATPLVALVALTSAILILASSWRQVDLPSARRLIVASLAGIPLGLLVLTRAPEELVVGVLGVVLLVFGAYRLFGPTLPQVRSRRWAYGMGLVAGILGGAYNTNGPPVVLYGALRRWPAGRFRATLQGYFLTTSVLIVTSHALAGLWTPAVLRLYLWVLPVALAALYLGGRLNTMIPARRFDKLLFLAFMVLGLLLLL